MSLEFIEVKETPEANPPAQATAPVEEKKRGRGRPRKGEEPTPKPQTKKAEPKPTVSSDIFERIANEVKANEPQPDPLMLASNDSPSTALATTGLIDGYLLLSFVDSIVPGLIKVIFKKKLANVKVENIALTEQQKNSLEPLADEIAKSVAGQVNPLQAGLLALSALYYQNAMKYAGKA